jgi:hypothetical protein
MPTSTTLFYDAERISWYHRNYYLKGYCVYDVVSLCKPTKQTRADLLTLKACRAIMHKYLYNSIDQDFLITGDLLIDLLWASLR